MGVLELIQQKAFLGKEFLTWLWFRSETSGAIEMRGGKMAEVEIMGPIVLDAQYGDARMSTLKGESPATSPEAHASLLEGKKLKRAKLKFKRDDNEWIATLDGENFNLTGLAMPEAGRMPFDDLIAVRMEWVMEFENILADLFEAFMTLRMDTADWSGEVVKIHDWVKAK